ncbi:conserved hypothetical protein [Ricinus communis]|uniref:Uncharacterized protein n=1 Tax=Ricinus communis TaxID=3988 RepID=B9SNC2_RICCO|nr:conserved hypothetical protein [Ricinus communis]
MMVQLARPIRPYGLGRHQLVILPLPRAGGCRCSVKPASRCALRSRNQVTPAFAQGHIAQLSAWNGRARAQPHQGRPTGPEQRPITLMPLLRLQAHATEPGD